MEVRAGYDEGHLVVAAIRVLAHRQEGRPPTVEEIAELLKLSREWVGVLVNALERAGAVRALTGPFETRVEIADASRLEDLPRGASSAGVDEELKEFAEKKRQEEEKLKHLFGGGAASREREKLDRMADRFKGYKPKPPKSAPFMKDPSEDT
jgi:DNA-binding Lrp family transcriptional regulator